MCFALYTQNGRVLAAAQCSSKSSINDLAVDPSVQRRGLGTIMLNQCLTAFWARNTPLVLAKTHSTNTAVRSFLTKSDFSEIRDLSG